MNHIQQNYNTRSASGEVSEITVTLELPSGIDGDASESVSRFRRTELVSKPLVVAMCEG